MAARFDWSFSLNVCLVAPLISTYKRVFMHHHGKGVYVTFSRVSLCGESSCSLTTALEQEAMVEGPECMSLCSAGIEMDSLHLLEDKKHPAINSGQDLSVLTITCLCLSGVSIGT